VPIEKLIQRPLRTLPPDANCVEAAVLLRDANVGAIVVEEGGRPLGVVTDRDVAVRVVAQGLEPAKTRVRDVMSGHPVYLSGERSLDQLIAAMRDLAIRRVPIVDADGKLQGLVSLDDLLILLTDQLGSLAHAIRSEIQPRKG
jgi:CBS domain-containing protein